MAEMDDDFNSSDIDIPEEAIVAPRWKDAGAKSIARMIDEKVENRLFSKVFEKTLTFQKGAPGTKYAQQLWSNRFNATRAEIFAEE